MNLHTFKTVKDRYLGKRGTAQREDYEYRLQCELVREQGRIGFLFETYERYVAPLLEEKKGRKNKK